MTPAHTGSQPGDALKPALTRRWEVDLGTRISYPLIADGSVYEIAYPAGSIGQGNLLALDQSSGRTVWSQVLNQPQFAVYDGGRVFVQDGNGQLQAFDSLTGSQLWSISLPGGQLGSTFAMPVAFHGIVYATGSFSDVIAVSESNGAVLWSIPGDSTPTLTNTGLFVAEACGQATDYNPATGAVIWQHAGTCSGGGETSVVYQGLLYARSGNQTTNVTLDVNTGSQIGSFNSGPVPAFDGNLGFFVNGGKLEARDLTTGALTWTFSESNGLGMHAGDDTLISAPAIANGYVYVASAEGWLFAISEATGRAAWQDHTFVSLQSPEQNALAIGQGGLAAPLGGTLVFYTSAPATTPSPQPPSGGIDQAAAYQLNAQHSGGQVADPLTFPLAKRWSVSGITNSYPLIAGGHVFFTSGGGLVALNETDGSTAWGPVALVQSSPAPQLAYDGGTVFAVSQAGAMWAFNAASGQQFWTTQLSQSSFQSYPTAANGVVYVAGSGSAGSTLFAVSEQTGAVLWSQNVQGSGDSSPVVTTTGVYLAYPCPEVYDFDPGTGALIWHVGPSSCTSPANAGPRSAVLYNGKLYVPDTASGLILDAATGTQLGVFRSTYPPVFSGSMAFYEDRGILEGWDLTTNSMVWQWDGDLNQAGNNGPRYYVGASTLPVVVNGDVLVGDGFDLYAFDGRTGHQVWTGATGSTAASANVDVALALSVGEGYAAVTTAQTVTVWSSGGLVIPPSPTAADESVSHQVNVAHDGGQPADPLTPPLTQRWSLDLGNPASYPLIVGGRAYVTARASAPNGSASQLYAVDLHTGTEVWGPFYLTGPTGGQAMLGADSGRVFVQQSGILHAYDAQNGTELWSRLASLGVSEGQSPVAVNGMLFAGPMRFDEETGAQIWRWSEVDSKLDVVTSTNVYVDIGCENTDNVATADGSEAWIHFGVICGSGTPDIEPALYGGRLYFHDYQPNPSMPLSIVDASSGAQLGTYWSDAPTAFAGTLAYFVKGGALEAHNLSDLSVAWTFAGDGALATAPVVANGVVYIGSSNGNLYALDASQGTQLWTINVGVAMSAPDGLFAAELTGFAVGEGWLLIPAGNHLIAFSSSVAPAVGAVSVSDGNST